MNYQHSLNRLFFQVKVEDRGSTPSIRKYDQIMLKEFHFIFFILAISQTALLFLEAYRYEELKDLVTSTTGLIFTVTLFYLFECEFHESGKGIIIITPWLTQDYGAICYFLVSSWFFGWVIFTPDIDLPKREIQILLQNQTYYTFIVCFFDLIRFFVGF